MALVVVVCGGLDVNGSRWLWVSRCWWIAVVVVRSRWCGWLCLGLDSVVDGIIDVLGVG